MDSKFKAMLDALGINGDKFEKYKIHSLTKLMDNCIIEARKKKVLKLLDIDELDFDCLLEEYKEEIETQNKKTNETQNVFESKIKYWLLTKPAQSGKTLEMIRDMIKNIERNNKRVMNILICDNSLIQTRQSVVRINKINLQEYDKIVACEISSNKDSKFKRENQFAKEKDSYNVIVMCSKRLENMELLLSHLKDRDIYLYLDEADKIVKDKSKVELIKNIERYKNVKNITFTTATPYIDSKTSLATLYGDLNLFPVSQNISEKYNSLKDMNMKFVKSFGDSNVVYAEEYLKLNPIKPGEAWLIPSEYRKFTHNQMKQMLFENNFADVVCIINSDTKCFYYKDGDTQQLGEFATSNSELKDIMENYIKETNKSNRIVITGNNCIGRGASFQSEFGLKFTGTIFGPKSASPDANAYQMLCRMASYCMFDQPQKLIIDEELLNLILPHEDLAFELLNASVESFNNKVVSTINHNDMKKVIRREELSNIIFCGKPFNHNDIKPFKSKQEAIEEIRKYNPNYVPRELEKDGNFYITENYCLSGKKTRRVVSWEDMRDIKNVKYGISFTDDAIQYRLRPCYLDVNDETTLRWSTVVRL